MPISDSAQSTLAQQEQTVLTDPLEAAMTQRQMRTFVLVYLTMARFHTTHASLPDFILIEPMWGVFPLVAVLSPVKQNDFLRGT